MMRDTGVFACLATTSTKCQNANDKTSSIANNVSVLRQNNIVQRPVWDIHIRTQPSAPNTSLWKELGPPQKEPKWHGLRQWCTKLIMAAAASGAFLLSGATKKKKAWRVCTSPNT